MNAESAFFTLGQVTLPNRMNFRKGSKRQLTPHPPPPRMVPISGNHVHAIHTISLVRPCTYLTISIIYMLQHKFTKTSWRVSKAVWNFSENSSDLVAGPFPKQYMWNMTSNVHPYKKGLWLITNVALWQGGLMDQMCPVLPKLLFDMWKAKSVPNGVQMMDSGKSSSQIFNSGESCSISSLPFEIVELILSFLSKPSSQLAASQVSPIFYQIQVNHCLLCTLGSIILLLLLTLHWRDSGW